MLVNVRGGLDVGSWTQHIRERPTPSLRYPVCPHCKSSPCSETDELGIHIRRHSHYSILDNARSCHPSYTQIFTRLEEYYQLLCKLEYDCKGMAAAVWNEPETGFEMLQKLSTSFIGLLQEYKHFLFTHSIDTAHTLLTMPEQKIPSRIWHNGTKGPPISRSFPLQNERPL